jgi:2-iminobutanoate/2-iminopropanoate deaminase
MPVTVIKTTAAPAPIGPYNQAIVAGGFIFISGQIAINPETGDLQLSSIEEETRQVLRNLEAILKEAGSGFAQVVKTTIFLSDMAHFTIVNDLYAQYFEKDFPARETVAVKTLPKSVNVEISMVAYKG